MCFREGKPDREDRCIDCRDRRTRGQASTDRGRYPWLRRFVKLTRLVSYVCCVVCMVVSCVWLYRVCGCVMCMVVPCVWLCRWYGGVCMVVLCVWLCRLYGCASTVEIEERGVKLRLTVVDTPGFGDSLNSQDWSVMYVVLCVWLCHVYGCTVCVVVSCVWLYRVYGCVVGMVVCVLLCRVYDCVVCMVVHRL